MEEVEARVEIPGRLLQGGLFSPGGVGFEQLPRRALRMWRLTRVLGGLGWSLNLGAIVALTILLLHLLGKQAPWWPVALCAWPMLWSVWMWFRLKVRWLFAGYSLGEEELWVRQGLFERDIEAVPYRMIQSVEVSSGPIQRRYNLASVQMSVGTFHSIGVEDIDPKVAEALRDDLRARAAAAVKGGR